MSYPTPEQQIQFLVKIQRLLSEGRFVASYKFALLQALADLSVEMGDDSGSPLTLSTRDIAEKFIHYYWRQAGDYVSPEGGKRGILKQNTGQQAAVINRIRAARVESDGKLYRVQQNRDLWRSLVKDVAATVRIMPLWKLQTVGDVETPFLYPNVGKGDEITLERGVAYCFRKFHALIHDLIQVAWLRFVRSIGPNKDLIGKPGANLEEFLFGSERSRLKDYQPILRHIQRGICFYCRAPLRGSYDIDHFVPWSRYPMDLGHNFVAAHKGCNNNKRDFLASVRFLEKWLDRNERCRGVLNEQFGLKELLHDEKTSMSITYWAYEEAQVSSAHLWDGKDKLQPVDPAWRSLFGPAEELVYARAADIKADYGDRDPCLGTKTR